MCHVTMLKAYVARDEPHLSKSARAVSAADIVHPVMSSAYCPEQDSLDVNDAQMS